MIKLEDMVYIGSAIILLYLFSDAILGGPL